MASTLMVIGGSRDSMVPFNCLYCVVVKYTTCGGAAQRGRGMSLLVVMRDVKLPVMTISREV